jgi:hypothetical protein
VSDERLNSAEYAVTFFEDRMWARFGNEGVYCPFCRGRAALPLSGGPHDVVHTPVCPAFVYARKKAEDAALRTAGVSEGRVMIVNADCPYFGDCGLVLRAEGTKRFVKIDGRSGELEFDAVEIAPITRKK